MIVRTYTRRSRCSDQSYSDAGTGTGASTSSSSSVIVEDAPFSQESIASLDPCAFGPPITASAAFLSQDSFDPDPYGIECLRLDAVIPPPAGRGKDKKPPKDGKSKKGDLGGVGRVRENGSRGITVASTSTLMEAQEFGEMMEHVDEVNFALDGLRRGQPTRIRRSSLLSLLSICSSSQQRRLLRAQGMAKRIVDAVMGLSFDDSASMIATSALLYVLASDVQDDRLLDSPSCIQFLLKLLNPPMSYAAQDKAPSIGARLLGINKNNTGTSYGPPKGQDSSSTAIMSKVQEILLSCNEIKQPSRVDEGIKRPELSSKWIVLLTLEKACISTISFEDSAGSARKADRNFKELLRELGGLDAIFNVAVSCHSEMEGWSECGVPFVHKIKDVLALQSVLLLLKCFKIMENATFLSKDNQNHLLGMNAKLGKGLTLSCVGLIISAIKLFSGISLLQKTSCGSSERSNDLSENVDIMPSQASGIELEGCTENCNRNFSSDSAGCCCSHTLPYIKKFEACHKRQKLSSFGSESSSPAPGTGCMAGTICSVKEKTDQNAQLSIGSKISCLIGGGLSINKNGSKLNSINDSNQWISINVNRPNLSKLGCSNGPVANGSKLNQTSQKKRFHVSDGKNISVEDEYDPFAFDEGDLGPSRWEVLATNTKQTRQSRTRERVLEEKLEHALTITINQTTDEENTHSYGGLSASADDEGSNLLEECLLTAVKVLMNLTNDNPVGCQQIGACGGLDTMASLIISHFPSFDLTSSMSRKLVDDISTNQPGNSSTQRSKHLNDHELEFLVAILGLLVNLVEKDSRNRSRLVCARVPARQYVRLGDKESRRDVIPLLCSIFLANQGTGESAEEVRLSCDDEAALLQGEREAEMMIIEAYAALLLAFLSTESRNAREAIASCLPNEGLKILVPVLERFVEFHLSLNMISPETHSIVSEVIESCRIP